MKNNKIYDLHTHPWIDNADPQKVLSYMDTHSIEVILSLGACLDEGLNDRMLSLRRTAPDRVIGGPYFDPADPSSIDALERYHDAGCRICKLFPNTGYYPDDPVFSPFFDKVAKLGWGVLTHCGWLGPSGKDLLQGYASCYARPSRFEILLRRYPDTLFIFAHLGGIDGYTEAAMYASRTPNAYIDITPGQSLWVLAHAAQTVQGIPAGRLLLGTDGLFFDKGYGPYEELKNALTAAGLSGSIDDIFSRNPARVIAEYGLLP